jgi:hypothetical protein
MEIGAKISPAPLFRQTFSVSVHNHGAPSKKARSYAKLDLASFLFFFERGR